MESGLLPGVELRDVWGFQFIQTSQCQHVTGWNTHTAAHRPLSDDGCCRKEDEALGVMREDEMETMLHVVLFKLSQANTKMMG